MIFSGLFRKRNVPSPDFSALGVDMHSHLVAGIDDGSTSAEHSVVLIRKLQDFGFKKLITTPHIMSDAYRNSPETILPGLDLVKAELVKSGINMPMGAAAEYYHDFEFTEKIGKEKLLVFGENYLLFEVSYMNAPENLNKTIFEMITNGYKPVLAHPERYPFWWSNFKEYEKLRDAGVLLQLNLNSLTGYYSPHAKRIAERLIDANMISFAGTDLHSERHFDSLARVSETKYYKKMMDSGRILNSTLF